MAIQASDWPMQLACVCICAHDLIKIIQFCVKIYDLWRHPDLWVGVWVGGLVDGWVNGWNHVKSLKIKYILT